MKKDRQRGLTLLETLVALVILAGSFTAALAMTRTADRLNAAAQRRQALVDNAYGFSRLHALLEAAAPIVRHARNGVPILDFAGDSTEVTFFSTHLAAAEKAPIERMTVRIVDGAITISRDGDTANDSSVPRTLARLDRAARFQFAEIGTNGELVFKDEWEDRPDLPVVIIVTSVTDSDVSLAPFLAATPRLSPEF